MCIQILSGFTFCSFHCITCILENQLFLCQYAIKNCCKSIGILHIYIHLHLDYLVYCWLGVSRLHTLFGFFFDFNFLAFLHVCEFLLLFYRFFNFIIHLCIDHIFIVLSIFGVSMKTCNVTFVFFIVLINSTYRTLYNGTVQGRFI